MSGLIRAILIIAASLAPVLSAHARVVGPPVDDAAPPPTISLENALMGPPAPASSMNPLRSMAAAGEAVAPGRGEGLSTALNIMLVLTVIYLFLGTVRAALIPAVTVPISLMATFILLWPWAFPSTS